MTKQDEYEGKDLEDALEIAASSEGVTESDLDYEIVEQGRRGVLGLGAKNVRIRVMPPLKGARDTAKGASGGGRRRARPKPGREPRSAPEGADVETKPASAEAEARAAEVEATVQRMVELMGLELEVKSTASDKGAKLRFDGPDQKMLKSKKGELLSAMQFLINRMARRAWPGIGRIDLGGDGPTRRRDEDIVELVREVARQVSRTGKTKKMKPMNAYERRLVHLTVREFPGLSSSSDGNGSLKRVRVSKVQNEI